MRKLLALALCVVPSLAAAQRALVVRVRSQGRPVPGVEVTSWMSTGRDARARTDDDGIATLRISGDTGAEPTITARRLGFAPRRVPTPGSGDTLSIELQAVASDLPALAVRARTLKCPVANDVRALQLLEGAARHYSGGQDSLWVGYQGRWVQDEVASDRRGFADVEVGQRRLGGIVPRATMRGFLVLPPEYARWTERGGWEYASLEHLSADHFTSAAFRELHTFAVMDTSSGDTVLGFCPRDANRPEIRGELVIARDSSLSGARWDFLVPRDADDAGGEASFAVGVLDGARYIVANRGSTWRRNGNTKLYLLSAFELGGWRIGRTREAVATGWNTRGDVNAPAPR